MVLKFIILTIEPMEIKHEQSFKHLVDAQMPFSYPQLKKIRSELYKTPVTVVTKGKYDEYGQTYEFGDEAHRTLWI